MKRAFYWAITLLRPIILKFHIHTAGDEDRCPAIADIDIHHNALIVSIKSGCAKVCTLPRNDRLISEHFTGIDFCIGEQERSRREVTVFRWAVRCKGDGTDQPTRAEVSRACYRSKHIIGKPLIIATGPG